MARSQLLTMPGRPFQTTCSLAGPLVWGNSSYFWMVAQLATDRPCVSPSIRRHCAAGVVFLGAGRFCFVSSQDACRATIGHAAADCRPVSRFTTSTMCSIRDLVVRGFGVDGVAVHDVVRETRLERVSCQDNGLAGFSCSRSHLGRTRRLLGGRKRAGAVARRGLCPGVGLRLPFHRGYRPSRACVAAANSSSETSPSPECRGLIRRPDGGLP